MAKQKPRVGGALASRAIPIERAVEQLQAVLNQVAPDAPPLIRRQLEAIVRAGSKIDLQRNVTTGLPNIVQNLLESKFSPTKAQLAALPAALQSESALGFGISGQLEGIAPAGTPQFTGLPAGPADVSPSGATPSGVTPTGAPTGPVPITGGERAVRNNQLTSGTSTVNVTPSGGSPTTNLEDQLKLSDRFKSGRRVQMLDRTGAPVGSRTFTVLGVNPAKPGEVLVSTGAKGSRATRSIAAARLAVLGEEAGEALAGQFESEVGTLRTQLGDALSTTPKQIDNVADWATKFSKGNLLGKTEGLTSLFKEAGLIEGDIPKSMQKNLSKLAASIADLGSEAADPAFVETLIARIEHGTDGSVKKFGKTLGRTATELKGGAVGTAAKNLSKGEGVLSGIGKFIKKNPIKSVAGGFLGFELLSRSGEIGTAISRAAGLETAEDIQRRVAPITAEGILRDQRTRQLQTRNLAAELAEQGASSGALNSILRNAQPQPIGSIVIPGG